MAPSSGTGELPVTGAVSAEPVCDTSGEEVSAAEEGAVSAPHDVSARQHETNNMIIVALGFFMTVR